MYDSFSSDYDLFVDWKSRLDFELPFLVDQINSVKPGGNVLDAACGTGMHAIAFAKRGYRAAGADLSVGMIEKARLHGLAVGVQVEWASVGFGEMASAFKGRCFDAVLCLGNSLPHTLTIEDLQCTLADFNTCLGPGGMLIIQNRNFDAVMANRQRWMEPQSRREGEQEWLFLRFYDFLPNGRIAFHILDLHRENINMPWRQDVLSTELNPLTQNDLRLALEDAGFSDLQWYGSLGGEPFDPVTSGNLVVTARKK
ncbi:MAG TPA: methyltransferase domain-containing protein [Longilinea sp.]|nr:methyltransferase domain-containing protein [Longilinea sp.]